MADVKRKIQFLSDPFNFPHKPSHVEPIETHMSWVFLAGNRVYKFKKPVQFPFLNFSTLSARELNCEEEFRLNKVLAADTYLRVVPLTEEPSGKLAIDGGGRIVEWLLEMKRLPVAQMLDTIMGQREPKRDEIKLIGEKLAHFYQNSPPQITDGPLYLKHLLEEHRANKEILIRPEFGLGDERTHSLLAEVDRQFESVCPEIETRIAHGWIVEGHGDLRPEHIHLGPPLQIIDRLEFDRSMRILDPYDEVNYLGLECEFMGVSWVRPYLLKILDDNLQAKPSKALMAYYSMFRAMLRARICIAHLLDKEPMTPEIWPERTRAYLRSAHSAFLSVHPQAGGE